VGDQVNAGAFGVNVLFTGVLALVLVTALFAVAATRKRYDIIDTYWGLGFAVIAVFTLLLAGPTPRTVLAVALTVIWGVRLGVHIGVRNMGKDEDPRYVDILKRAKGNPLPRMYRVFLVQAVIMIVVSLPVQVAAYLTAPLGVLDYLAVLVWLVGFAFESVGDWQLSRFRAAPANKGAVMDRGLWRYTRHPNYFGDACVWWGLFLFACHHWTGLLTAVAPVIMTLLLAKGTGKPLLEKDIAARRPGYVEYVRRTSGFFPLPPKPVA
jgi:steroid 5-alpha reductase family enzyme